MTRSPIEIPKNKHFPEKIVKKVFENIVSLKPFTITIKYKNAEHMIRMIQQGFPNRTLYILRDETAIVGTAKEFVETPPVAQDLVKKKGTDTYILVNPHLVDFSDGQEEALEGVLENSHYIVIETMTSGMHDIIGGESYPGWASPVISIDLLDEDESVA